MEARPPLRISTRELRAQFQRHFHADRDRDAGPRAAGTRRSLRKTPRRTPKKKAADAEDPKEDDDDEKQDDEEEDQDEEEQPEDRGDDPDYQPPGGAGGAAGTSAGWSGSAVARGAGGSTAHYEEGGHGSKKTGSHTKGKKHNPGTGETAQEDKEDFDLDELITYCRGLSFHNIHDDDPEDDGIKPEDSISNISSADTDEDAAAIRNVALAGRTPRRVLLRYSPNIRYGGRSHTPDPRGHDQTGIPVMSPANAVVGDVQAGGHGDTPQKAVFQQGAPE